MLVKEGKSQNLVGTFILFSLTFALFWVSSFYGAKNFTDLSNKLNLTSKRFPDK